MPFALQQRVNKRKVIRHLYSANKSGNYAKERDNAVGISRNLTDKITEINVNRTQVAMRKIQGTMDASANHNNCKLADHFAGRLHSSNA